MKYASLFLVCCLTLLFCSPNNNSSNTKKGTPQTLVQSGNFANPPLPCKITMQSTGKPSAGLSKTAGFTYPAKTWIPSTFYSGCPDYVDLTIISISAWGKWINPKVHIDTITYDTVVADSTMKDPAKKDTTVTYKIITDTAIKNSGKKYWDTIIIKRDTITWEGYRDLWAGSKTVRFDGSAATLTNFDTLHIPQGKLYVLRLLISQAAKIKGSITGKFCWGFGDSAKTAQKTYYTKSAYAFNAQTNQGGSSDPSVFETGPAEESDIMISTYDTSSHDPKEIPGTVSTHHNLILDSPCSTSVEDSAHLTILFDISRVLSFYDGDSLSQNGGPRGAPANKAFFYAHNSFTGSARTSIAAVFPGGVGTIEGYKAEFVWCNYQADADSAGPWLQNDTTYGGYGWLTLIFDQTGKWLGGKMFQDNGTFCPSGSVDYFNQSEQRLILGLNPATFYIWGFRRAIAIGDTTYCKTYYPKWSSSDGSHANARTGELKFTLQLVQK